MLEAKEACAYLEDIDEGTFVRFIQYLYTGDYTEASPEILVESSNIGLEPEPIPVLESEAEGASERNADDFAVSSRRYKKAKSKGSIWDATGPSSHLSLREQACGDFQEGCPDRATTHWEPRANREACEDYTEVLSSHARLYILADRFDIEALQALALQKLQMTLSRFKLHEERTIDLIRTLQYTYENTLDKKHTTDRLRLLLVKYVACFVEDFCINADFCRLLEEPGEISRDLLLNLLCRLD